MSDAKNRRSRSIDDSHEPDAALGSKSAHCWKLVYDPVLLSSEGKSRQYRVNGHLPGSDPSCVRVDCALFGRMRQLIVAL